MIRQSGVLREPAAPAPETARADPDPAVLPRPTAGQRHDVLSDSGVGWIAAHGGAGATTLTRLLGGTDIGCRWPDAALAEPARVMLAGRTNLDGLRAVARALRVMREGRHPAGMRLLGVVLLADAPGRLPGALISRIRMVRSLAPVHRVPWIPALRLGETPARLPAQLIRLSDVLDLRREVPR